MSMEAVESISSNIDLIVDVTDNQSKMLISSAVLQNVLGKGSSAPSFDFQQELDSYLENFKNFNDTISSVYIFDNYGNEYFVDNEFPIKEITLDKIKNSSWYDDLIQKRGGFILKLNGGGTFQDVNENYISMIRVVNSTNTQKPIGVMVINISESYIESTLFNGDSLLQNIILLDENGNSIISANLPENNKLIDEFKQVNGNSNSPIMQKIGSKEYIIANAKNQYSWKIISINLFNELSKQNQNYGMVILIAVFINGLLLIVGLLFISLIITKPIKKLEESMIEVESGKFKEVNVRTGNDEIGKLKDIYNMMIRQIQKLFVNIIDEQNRKRKAELDLLQSQIKPHFLYNSLDAISFLVMSNENEEALKSVKALGQFYRQYLNKGNEETTIKDELDMIKNYLYIQKIRLCDKFSVETEIDERVLGYKIPHLTLQPIVENAIKHGIKGKPGNGKILIRAEYFSNLILLTVEDDGIGMDRSMVEGLKSGIYTGVGLKATIERLNIYYNSNNLLKIESEKGKGTKVIITIPTIKES